LIVNVKFYYQLALFIVINFGALALGSTLMNNGPQSLWYMELNKAPWSPPGWVFGVAWTTIMICFSLYMTFLIQTGLTAKKIGCYSLQVLLNVVWNYIFFNQQLIFLGLVCIGLLTVLILYMLLSFRSKLYNKNWLLFPYAIWLILATSLNLYIFIYN
jgi:tryptophan-rich sensory protein